MKTVRFDHTLISSDGIKVSIYVRCKKNVPTEDSPVIINYQKDGITETRDEKLNVSLVEKHRSWAAQFGCPVSEIEHSIGSEFIAEDGEKISVSFDGKTILISQVIEIVGEGRQAIKAFKEKIANPVPDWTVEKEVESLLSLTEFQIMSKFKSLAEEYWQKVSVKEKLEKEE